MSNIVKFQLYQFCIFFLTGIYIGILFDVFRILRKSFKTPNLITYIEDIIFGILGLIIFLFVLLKFNNGEIRNYVIIGFLLGIISYLIAVSKYFIKINVMFLNLIKKIIYIPYSLLIKVFKLLLKPFCIIIINIHKFTNIFCKKLLNNRIKPINFRKKHAERRILKVNVEKYK